MESEQEPFLPPLKGGTHHSSGRNGLKILQQSLPKLNTVIIFSILQLLLLSLYTVATVWILRTKDRRLPPSTSVLEDLEIVPAQRIFHNLSRNDFAGEPSSDIDSSWDERLAPMNIRVTKAELGRANIQSIALEDGGYLSWIGAFHQLYCINMLRKWIYKHRYHTNLTQKEEKHLGSHVGMFHIAEAKRW
ncbi:hypothetical protein XANCAGTX0491_006004 [Xanthoria calcicola]